ncbi:MAG: hypothetical protein LBD85_01760 [Oscillospiraceae bacterium]|jgi:hypothetical protein|nr:hypothetical protein [Oscillospiraceae bacterium]
MNRDNIYIVLSKSPTILSRAIHRISGDAYTHAALAMDRDLKYMFSFGRRWAKNPFIGCFRRERLDEGIYKYCDTLPGTVMKIGVSPEQYVRVNGMLTLFSQNRSEYGYNYIGLLAHLFNLSYQTNNSFFCSEFVYHVLRQSGVTDWNIPRGRVKPYDLMRLNGEIVFRGDLMQYSRKTG